MSKIPNDRRYIDSHEWVLPLGDGVFRIGITDHAQHLLGDLVYVEAPAVGKALKTGQDCAVVESVKAASDVYSPLSGTVTASNAALSGAPETINQDPYGAGWLFDIKADNVTDYDNLLDAAAYQTLIAEG